MGYALADSGDRPEPWGLRGSVTYRLMQDSGGGWRVDGWAGGATGRVAQGWPADVPVPDGYLPSPPVPAADADARDAVREAAKKWAGAPASDVTVEQAADGQDGAGAVTATATAAPARGDAAGDSASTRTLWLDRGRSVLSETAPADGGKAPRWTERDATAAVEFGVSAPVSPFAVAALLADADAAAPAACPERPAASRCFTALVATADPSVELAADTGLARRAGTPWLVLDVGLNGVGRPAFVRLAQTAQAFGRPYARLVSTAVFTGYAASPPPPPDKPAPDARVPVENGVR